DAERNEAWQSLVRVMSHEINNSLSPIKSLAETWSARLADPAREIERGSLADSLALIARRSGGLSRFVGIYAGLAKLPEPSRAMVDLGELLQKICALESRVPIRLEGAGIAFELDADQIEQAMINLVRNAVDAVAECRQPEVVIRCAEKAEGLRIEVIDNGPGPPDSDNLFVPFFTTKPDGSGIGLLLVRRIAELHGGTFDQVARSDGNNGAVARLWLPVP
ncbi:MAG: ATP-binding protein, partial [Wenzhouxiangellaceae bacterium]